MRTFPKGLAELRRVVSVRAAELRGLPRAELVDLGARPFEPIDVQGRPASIGVVVQLRVSGDLRVMVVADMPGRWLRFVKSFAFDGFVQRPDGSVEELSDDEIAAFEDDLAAFE